MHIIRENINGKVFVCNNEDRLAEYAKNNKENEDVDLTIYKVVESKSGVLKLEKLAS